MLFWASHSGGWHHLSRELRWVFDDLGRDFLQWHLIRVFACICKKIFYISWLQAPFIAQCHSPYQNWRKTKCKLQTKLFILFATFGQFVFIPEVRRRWWTWWNVGAPSGSWPSFSWFRGNLAVRRQVCWTSERHELSVMRLQFHNIQSSQGRTWTAYTCRLYYSCCSLASYKMQGILQCYKQVSNDFL